MFYTIYIEEYCVRRWIVEGTPECRGLVAADGKVIKAGAVSVQSNLTYEKEFALEMEKAKVRPGSSLVME